MDPCTPGFDQTIVTLGKSGINCTKAPMVVSVRNPFHLVNGTLPVVELLMISLAVAGLTHAVLWWRQRRDPTNLALWFACVVYVLVLEPITYFPQAYGLQDRLDLIFVHNLFTVNFLWDRLPLYILAIYPGQTYLMFALVQRTGLLERRHPLLSASAVAAVFQVGYETFDHIGPQLRWWAWNAKAASNQLMVGSVPLSSAVIFGVISPFGLTLLVLLLVRRRVLAGPVSGLSLTVRAALAGALAPLAMTAIALPATIFMEMRSRTGERISQWSTLAVIMAAGVFAFVRTWRESGGRMPGMPGMGRGFLGWYAPAAGAIYALTFVGLWADAFPALLAAHNGMTAEGTPIGSVPYASLCIVGFTMAVVLSGSSGMRVLGHRAEATVPAMEHL